MKNIYQQFRCTIFLFYFYFHFCSNFFYSFLFLYLSLFCFVWFLLGIILIFIFVLLFVFISFCICFLFCFALALFLFCFVLFCFVLLSSLILEYYKNAIMFSLERIEFLNFYIFKFKSFSLPFSSFIHLHLLLLFTLRLCDGLMLVILKIRTSGGFQVIELFTWFYS